MNDDRDPRTDPRAPTATRLLSLAAVAVVFVLYEPGAPVGLLNSFVLPALGAVAAWFVTRSPFVLALGTALLAGAHADLSSAHWYDAVLAPVFAVCAGAVTLAICALRFRTAMALRREARRALRPESDGASSTGDDSDV